MILQVNPVIIWRVIVLILAIGISCCVDGKTTDIVKFKLQCIDNNTATLEFTQNKLGKLLMYNEITDWPSPKVCGERRIHAEKQLLEPKCQTSRGTYYVHIFRDEDNFGSNIVAHPDDVVSHFFFAFDCRNQGLREPVWVYPQDNSWSLEVEYSVVFYLQNQTFLVDTRFTKNDRYTGELGDQVKMEFEIQDRNLFGNKSHFVTCKLDLPHEDHVESVYLLRNSSLTPEGRAIDFRAEYSPARRFYLAQYTVYFKAFMLQNRKFFNFNCEACKDCDEPVSN